MNSTTLLKKITLYLVRLIGIFLLLVSIIAILSSISTIERNISRGVLGIGSSSNDSSIVILSIIKGSGADEVGLCVGDTIFEVNGYRKNLDRLSSQEIWGKPVAGEKLSIKAKNGNQIKNLIVTRKPDMIFDKLINILFSLEIPFLLMFYVLVGLWGIFKKDFSHETILIAMVCYSFGTMLYCLITFDATGSAISDFFYLYQIKQLINDLFLFVPSFWIFLFLTFPERNEFYSKHRVLLITLIFILPVVLISIGIFLPSQKALIEILVIINLIYIVAGIFIGLIILHRTSKRAKNILQKRQLRLIFFGIRSGAISMISGWLMIFIYVTFFRGNMILAWITLPLFLLAQIGGLIIPFTFLNSFFKNRLLETEYALRKKVRYLFAAALLFIVYLSIIFLVGKFFIDQLKITDSSLIIIFILLIATTYYPIHKRLLSWLEKKIYPERTKYQNLLKELSKKLPGFLEIKELLGNTSKWFEEIIGVKPAVAIAFYKSSDLAPFSTNNSKSILNKVKDGSSFFWDEIREKDTLEFDPTEREWAFKNDISITLPMVSYGELVGLINIGKKINHEDFTGQDLDILKDASLQVAMAIQNLSLQSEYIEKKRMDKELEVARIIQSQLLPHEFPKVNGLKIFGKMRPCFEVAGDYLDIISLDENRVVLAVGDVSGKGAGAALLMSNLQAGLRSALRFTKDLSNIVFEINNMIHQNTNPAQFITFFIGIWDYSLGTFQYVNAGHNPPILLKSDNSIVRMEASGLFLGPIPDMAYTANEVKIEPDDIIAIYTDGIEESFNKEEEQFGDERIIESLIEYKKLEPEAIVNNLFKTIEEFSAGVPYSDDATIIVAKSIK